MTTPKPRTMAEVTPIAQAILTKAAIVDPRVRVSDELGGIAAQVAAWAELLRDSDVFLQEGLDAVAAHYRKPNAFPIMPGDVIGYVNRLPVTSSPERVRHWLRKWSYFPYSTVIQEKCGLHWAPPEPPAEVAAAGTKAVRQFHRGQFQAWIGQNLIEIEGRVLASAGDPRSLGSVSVKSLEG
ncbi:hypothetical protein SEA_SPEEDDEMON_880 [Gordonia phage SpeedDemon]|nr:hypothetical protein SEA_SPEEDDEMON_880 [Gordonia phage SpeedDemon]